IDGGAAYPVWCAPLYSLGPSGLTWSPNGYEIAFSGETGATNSTAILVLNLRTEELRVVADWFAWQENPTFSPDGKKIAFESVYNPSEEFAGRIWVANSNGTEVEELYGETWAAEPSWSPDGEQIAVASYDEEEEERTEEEAPGIALLNSKTGALEKWYFTAD